MRRGGGESRRDADEQARGGEDESFAEDHAEDVGRSGAEGEADADVVRLAGDGVGDDAENSDGGEKECDGGEEAEERSAEARLVDG